ncbi:hypothetical protein BH23BAC2_BH23BAC2_00720 [soil metagenome]
MGRFKSLFIDCTEAVHCCDKAQYNEATLAEKIKIHIHNLMCKPCKKYTRKNSKLTALVKKANLKSSTKAEKKKWKEHIANGTM